MKIISNNIIPFGKKFAAINLFGVLFIKKNVNITPQLFNHENIHTAQIKELLWIPFYIIYLAEWVIRLIQFKGHYIKAYENISFEKEAYSNDANISYLSTRRHFSQWRKQ